MSGPSCVNSQREDGGEHDGVEETHRDDAAHRDSARGGDRDPDQRGGDHGRAAQHLTRRRGAQHGGADEAPDHRTAPIEGNVACRDALRQAADIRLREVIDQEAADGNFRAHVDENADGAQHEVAVLPDAVAGQDAVAFFDIGQGWQVESRHTEGEQEECERDPDVRQLDGARVGPPGRLRQNQESAEIRRDGGSERVERLRQVQAAGRLFGRPELRHVRVGGHLQERDPGGEHPQRAEKQGVGLGRGRRVEHQGAHPMTANPSTIDFW